MNHVMIDLETLSTRPDAAILQCSAVRFDPATGATDPHTFNQYLSRDANDKAGRHVDQGTLDWWAKQGQTARDALARGEATAGTRRMGDLLRALDTWVPNGAQVWSNGATFDVAILEDAYRSIGSTPPWKFWNVRDVRTMTELGKVIGVDMKRDFPFEGTAHNALDDCHHQVKYVSVIWQMLTAVYV